MWFDHVEKMSDGTWVKRVWSLNAEGVFVRGRPKTTWDRVIQKELGDVGLNRDAARDRAK